MDKNHDIDKLATDPLIARMDAGNEQPLRLADEADVAASLRRLLNEQESMFPELDSERLSRAAWLLKQAGKWNGPAVAMAWLKESPSHARLAAVLSVLLVSWNRSPGPSPPDPFLVDELLSTFDALPYDVISENGLLIVLMNVSRTGLPAPLAGRVRQLLERAREVPDRQPEIRAQLDAFLNTRPC